MARQQRMEYAGAFYHVMARGNRRGPIVSDDADRRLFLRTLGEACAKTGWRIHAWVLMENHYHLLLETPEPNLVSGMQWFQNTYTRRFNLRHRFWGHLFGGRYKAVLVEAGISAPASSPYFSILIDYIHLNPYRAGLAKPGRSQGLLAYPWNSLRQAYVISESKRPPWMEVQFSLQVRGGEDTPSGRKRYLRHLEEIAGQEETQRAGFLLPEGQTLQSTLERGWYWGGEGFRDKLMRRLEGEPTKQNRTYRSSRQGREHGEIRAETLAREGMKAMGLQDVNLDQLKGSDSRKVVIAVAIKKQTTVPLEWIARRLKMKSSANVSQQVKRHRQGAIKLEAKQSKWLSGIVD